jgi:hypothetical protein
MKQKIKFLLLADAVINLALGLLLLLFPAGVLKIFGLPPVNSYFYSSILGGVIFGIGIALSIELLGTKRSFRGLSLGGAIAINLCGGGTLLYWLITQDIQATNLGLITLWIIALIVIGIGVIELVSGAWKNYDEQ